MIRRTLALAALFLCGTASATAADLPTSNVFDQQVIDALKGVHNQGADLYNTGDPSGCLRMYQGALAAVRPLLGHHPAIQRTITDGLANAAQLDGTRAQAFRLHELIEEVRAKLKDEVKSPPEVKPEPKKPEPKKEPEPKKPEPKKEPEPKKPEPKKTEPKKTEPAPMPKPTTPPEPKKTEPAPMPKPKEPAPTAGKTGSVSGKLTVDDKPADEAEVTFVQTGSPKPQVFTAKVKGGSYRFSEPLPAGDYAVMVTGSAKSKIADKYQTVQSSGLTAKVKEGSNSIDLKVVSK